MRIIAKSSLIAFFTKHADAKQALLAWHAHVAKAHWRSPSAVKADFATASILQDGRVVFNIGGNKYRLVTWINFDFQVVYVRFVGTHTQYDKIDAQVI
jgi:mRNA interferase HigB